MKTSFKITLIKNIVDVGVRYNIRVFVESSKKVSDKYTRQEGEISDSSGSKHFVIWSDSNLPYLESGKEYILENVLLYDYKGKFQVQFDKYSKIQSKELEKIRVAFKKIAEEKKKVEKHNYKLDQKKKDIESTKKHIDKHREETKESIRYLENKRVELIQDRFLMVFGYIILLVILTIGGLYIYDFAAKRIMPKVNDIIDVIIKNESIAYKVVDDNKKLNIVTLESLDDYKEKIIFTRPLNLNRPSKEAKENYKKYKENNKSRIFSYNLDKNKEPIAYIGTVDKKIVSPVRKKIQEFMNTVSPKKKKQAGQSKKDVKVKKTAKEIDKTYLTKSQLKEVVYVNSEMNTKKLMTLPGIGPYRVGRLKRERSYYSIEDVRDGKIGVGTYWAKKRKDGVKSGLIVFD